LAVFSREAALQLSKILQYDWFRAIRNQKQKTIVLKNFNSCKAAFSAERSHSVLNLYKQEFY